ncbi:hypothetical protein [Agrobacterium rubi]|uniref:Uncharacterized protein n=2 Tax=Agrobacterium rubi TaxID=28099 RepID=A0AAE7REL5_9HYPH|nr:hypothetical protein [Agrobacterium rubi]MBP1878687.1 hypothetical protein [Agrobacterium rubi]MCL6652952.1 hypothetical protein [Agrobacterium rubi]NTE88690.1 hypothetical protein [Agrobacterium rubi]NTF04518.1 hypothetical protein [Agrobacterium rubi]NTF10050.1 hypothetical protein [Agrobacterium rubi]
MPLQNRVDPFGDIVDLPLRGLFTGNRGIIHDPDTKTLTTKRWTSKSWLVCTCDYKDVRRNVMATRSWTELFFFDEATALAAGHRPCFQCRREDADRFRAAWASGNETSPPSAKTMDSVLHKERLQSRRKRLNMLLSPLEHLPDGAMIAAGGEAFLIVGGKPYHWGINGYQPAKTLPFVDGLLTPPSTLNTLRAGYVPRLHPSVARTRERVA